MIPKSEETDTARVIQADRDAAVSFLAETLETEWNETAVGWLAHAFAKHRLAQASPADEVRGALIEKLRTRVVGDGWEEVEPGKSLPKFKPDPLCQAAADALSAASAGVRDAGREAIARIIAPDAWRAYDATLRPFLEARGAHEGESWHVRAYMAGCRTADDARLWWHKTAEDSEPVQVDLFRASLVKADAIAALTARPDGGQTGKRSCTCHPDDRPDGDCRERYAASECIATATGGADREIEAAITRMIHAISTYADRDFHLNPIQESEREWIRPIARAALDTSAAKEAGK